MLSNNEKNQRAIIVNQSLAEDAADVRAEIANENADRRHHENCGQHGSTRRILYGVVGSFVAVFAIGAAYHFHTLDKSDKRNFSLRQETEGLRQELEEVTKSRDSLAVKYHNSQRTIHGLREEVAVLETKAGTLEETIIALHNAADREEQKNDQYYGHMEERSESYVDHIMTLHAALEAKDNEIKAAEELAERRKNQRDLKKKFMSMVFAISRDNPMELADAVENIGVPEHLVEMKFYPLALEVACGLGASNILNYIKTIEGWDKNIPEALAERVLNPHTVPLAKYEDMKRKHDQQGGRLNDMKLGMANQAAFIEELKSKVYDENYLPYSREQVMIIEAYHTVAENLRPKNLKKWIGTATPEQWVAYLRMAVDRNSYNVFNAIMEHDEVTSIPEVAAFIEVTEVLAKLKR